MLSAMKIRRWVGELLGRSILIGSVGSIGLSMHDSEYMGLGCSRVPYHVSHPCCHSVVRDYTLSCHSPSEHQRLQAAFVQCTLAVAGGRDRSKTASAKDAQVAGGYASTAFSYHVANAIATPYATDELAKVLVLQDDHMVVYQVFLAVKTLADLVALAEHFTAEQDHWSAAKLCSNIAQYRAGLDRSAQLEYSQLTLESLAKVPPQQHEVEALSLQVKLQTRVIQFTQSEKESEDAAGIGQYMHHFGWGVYWLIVCFPQMRSWHCQTTQLVSRHCRLTDRGCRFNFWACDTWAV